MSATDYTRTYPGKPYAPPGTASPNGAGHDGGGSGDSPGQGDGYGYRYAGGGDAGGGIHSGRVGGGGSAAMVRPRGRRPREYSPADVATLIGSGINGFCVSWLVFARFTDGVGWLGFIIVTYVAFMATFAIVTYDRLGLLATKDRVATVFVVTGAIVLLIPLAWLIGYIIVRGLPALRPSFLTNDQTGITPVEPSTAGGGAHAIVGTLEQVALALVMSLPLALAAAVFLNESRSRWRRPVRIFVDAMSGLPSIVAGLFIYATLIFPYANSGNPVLNFSGFMASLALSMIMLPTITRTVDVVLRLVPDGLREASLGMGASRARTVWSVVFPTARTGIATAVVLGMARVVGETAPLLFTAFGFNSMNWNVFEGSQESLPLFVYRNIRLPNQHVIERGFAGALMLLGVVLSLFAVARFIGRDRSRVSGRARWRRAQTAQAQSATAQLPFTGAGIGTNYGENNQGEINPREIRP